MITTHQFTVQVNNDGDSLPSFTETLYQHAEYQLTAEVFLNNDFPIVLFCIYINGEGEYAGNTLEDAVTEFNRLCFEKL